MLPLPTCLTRSGADRVQVTTWGPHRQLFAAVFSGHGSGSGQCSEFVLSHMKDTVEAFLADGAPDNHGPGRPTCEDALTQAFAHLDARWKEEATSGEELSGTSATVAMMDGDRLVVANVGSALAVLQTLDGLVPLTTDHSVAVNAEERSRCRRAGHKVARLRASAPLCVWPRSPAMAVAIVPPMRRARPMPRVVPPLQCGGCLECRVPVVADHSAQCPPCSLGNPNTAEADALPVATLVSGDAVVSSGVRDAVWVDDDNNNDTVSSVSLNEIELEQRSRQPHTAAPASASTPTPTPSPTSPSASMLSPQPPPGYIVLQPAAFTKKRGLAVTRSIGDVDAGDTIMATPAIRTVRVPAEGARLIFGSRGLWGGQGQGGGGGDGGDGVGGGGGGGGITFGFAARRTVGLGAAAAARRLANDARELTQDQDITVVVVDTAPSLSLPEGGGGRERGHTEEPFEAVFRGQVGRKRHWFDRAWTRRRATLLRRTATVIRFTDDFDRRLFNTYAEAE